MENRGKPFDDQEEAILWRGSLAGDAQLFENLVDQTYDLLFQYGCKFCRDRDLVKDCIQDVFLEVWEKRQLLNANIPPRPYFLASLRRRLHRVVQYNRMSTFGDYDKIELDFESEFSVEQQFIQLESDQRLATELSYWLNELPKRQKEAVYLRFFHDLSRDEIAEIMDIHPQSVSNLLQTAFKWLKIHWKVGLMLCLRFWYQG
ncbi:MULTISPECIES: RNA polymerase sigma factor [Spirosoma]|uniref:Sigma-70 family RNA polymerase sigma factor n=1 Tax=Spirosoma sordidisoli TaxID=2502893 RepID=A0A4Q2UR40_9BACT|nr:MULTISPECIES: sigma-70 family RNA polymerase sigma factor [Spirosoma]RYC70120.1 sigma-70 family RNA polymerase sigma factor [Spirosoma sordidisoli]